MVSTFEMHMALMTIAGRFDYADKAYHTLAVVRASCEDDLLPEWLQQLLIKRIKQEIINGTWPLLTPPAS